MLNCYWCDGPNQDKAQQNTCDECKKIWHSNVATCPDCVGKCLVWHKSFQAKLKREREGNTSLEEWF